MRARELDVEGLHHRDTKAEWVWARATRVAKAAPVGLWESRVRGRVQKLERVVAGVRGSAAAAAGVSDGVTRTARSEDAGA